MKFIKLDGVKIISKTTQQQIKGGHSDCSHAAQGARMNACMIAGGQSSQACYDQSFGANNGC